MRRLGGSAVEVAKILRELTEAGAVCEHPPEWHGEKFVGLTAEGARAVGFEADGSRTQWVKAR